MSSTRTSLRRSRRAPKKQLSEYNVGDVVEMDRNNVKVEGRLAQLLTEGSSVHPRWLVKFEGPFKDEEVYEHTFGRVLEAAVGVEPTESDDGGRSRPAVKSATASSVTATTTKPTSLPVTKTTSNNNLETSTTSTTASNNTNKNNNVNDSSPLLSEESSTAMETDNAKKVSAREARSRRRQAMIDEFGMPVLLNNDTGGGGKRKLNVKGNNNNNFATSNANAKKQRKPHEDPECLKIKLLTGTLYLYRGKHRRAAFVRRV